MDIQASVNAFKKAIKGHAARPDALAADFKDMLTSCTNPSNYWDFMNNGAFKECFELPNSNLICKFASCENYTAEEQATLSLAKEANLLHFFPSTIYIPFDAKLPVEYLESDEYNYTWNYHSSQHTYIREGNGSLCVYLDCAIVQEKVAVVCNQDEQLKYIDEEYNKNPIYKENGEIIPLSLLIDAQIDSTNWIRAAVRFYGFAGFKELCDFIIRNDISDLARRNLGYMEDGRPVILDWCS